MTEPAVEIQARLNTEDAKREAQSFGEQLLGALTPTIDVAQLAMSALGAIKDTLVGAVQASVGAALESEATQGKLAAALRLSGDATGILLARTQSFNNVLAAKIGLDDDDAAALQTKLLALGVLPDQLEAATRATLGLADATGKDSTKAAREVARAFKEGGDESARLESLFEITRAEAEGLNGALTRLGTQSGELTEDLGSVITQNEEIARAAQGAADNVEFLRSKFSAYGGELDSIADQAGKTASFINALGSVAIEAGDKALPLLAEGLGNAYSQLFLGIPSLRALGEDPALMSLVKEWTSDLDEFRSVITRFGDEIRREELELARGAQLAGRLRAMLADAGEVFPGDEEDTGPGKKIDVKERLGLNKKGTRDFKAKPDKSRRQLSAEAEGILEATETNQDTLDEGARQLEEQRKIEEQRKDIIDMGRLNQMKAEDEKAAFLRERAKEESEIQNQRVEQERQFWGQVSNIVTGGVANYVTQLVAAAAAGESIDFGKMFGGMLVTMGQSAIALGTTGVAAALLGSVAPWLAPATGGPVAIGPALGLIAAGIAAVGVGSALGGGGGSTAATPTATTAPSGGPSAVRAAAIPTGFSASPRQPTQTVINVNFGRGVIVGTPREAGRQIRELLTNEASLRNAVGAR